MQTNVRYLSYLEHVRFWAEGGVANAFLRQPASVERLTPSTCATLFARSCRPTA